MNRRLNALIRLPHAAVACMLPVTGKAAVSEGLTHKWNFDESRDWHDSPYAAAARPGVFSDPAGSLTATPSDMDNSAVIPDREFMALSFPGNGPKLQVAKNLAPELGGTASLAFWMHSAAAGGTDFAKSRRSVKHSSVQRFSYIQAPLFPLNLPFHRHPVGFIGCFRSLTPKAISWQPAI